MTKGYFGLLSTLLALVSLSSACAGATPAASTPTYFPASLLATKMTCPGWRRPDSAVSRIEAAWYPRHWRAAGEAPLYQQTGLAHAPGRTSYRFTWLRTFDAPVIVRLDRTASNGLRLTAKKLYGQGGYQPGAIVSSIERNLTPKEQRAFYRALSQANDLRLPAKICRSGYDGASWILESNRGGDYRYVNRWTPTGGPIRNLGLLMLGFTEWPLDPIY